MISHLLKKVIQGGKITKEDALKLSEIADIELDELLSAATEIREKFCGKKVDICSIINVKSGACSENCKYCAQSAHNSSEVDVYPLLEPYKVLERAKYLEAEGAKRFSLVASGRGVHGNEFDKVLDIYSLLKKETNLKLCASLGIISSQQLAALKQVGVERYHHNLETSERYFGEICTTHTFQERIKTITDAKYVGLEVCSGGIISMGETMEDRIDMTITLRELDIKSIPINILNAIKGTPLENQQTLDMNEILKTIAIVRFLVPDAFLRYAGGREKAMGDAERKGYLAGMNAVLVGSYLTSSGKTIQEDLNILSEMGFEF